MNIISTTTRLFQLLNQAEPEQDNKRIKRIFTKDSYVLHYMEHDIAEATKLCDKHVISWRLYKQLFLLMAQKDAIEKTEYISYREAIPNGYRKYFYFIDGSCYSYTRYHDKALNIINPYCSPVTS